MIAPGIAATELARERMLLLDDELNHMQLWVPTPIGYGRPRLTVNPKDAFDFFRTRVVDGTTITLGCPVGLLSRRTNRCKGGMIPQAFVYPEGSGPGVLRDFLAGRLQARHYRDQDLLVKGKGERFVQKARRVATEAHYAPRR